MRIRNRITNGYGVAIGTLEGVPSKALESVSNALTAIKSLSVNNVYGEFHFSERDDRRRKMVETKEAAFELLVAHEQLAKAIEPAMRDFDNPPPRPLGRMPSNLFGFLPASFDVGNVVMLFDDGKSGHAGIAGIGTQVLAASLGWRRPLYHDRLQNRGNLADIMSICSGHDDRERDATAVHEQVTLAPIFSPDPSGWVRRLLVPAAPSSLPRRYSAIATQYPPGHRTP